MTTSTTRGDAARAGGVASGLSKLIGSIFPDGLPVQIAFWDGTSLGPSAEGGVIKLTSRDALGRLIWSPDELGIARGFVAGDIEIEGDIFMLLSHLRRFFDHSKLGLRTAWRAGSAALRLGALRRPEPPSVEVRLRGRVHSRRRDTAAISHHYDVGNQFYRQVLGPTMTYSCAYFATPSSTLDDAQYAKHDLVCRKLGLHERSNLRLLDVGCGWGSMAIHAATAYGAKVVGVTLSHEQAKAATERVVEAGLAHLIEIREADYRELGGETFDAISSIGMFEHVGRTRMAEYFEVIHGLLEPGGRLLNHAISTPGGSRMHGRTFVNRYVFPDGELLDVADVVGAMEKAGFEVRDVESLREHYSLTLHGWVRNLEVDWVKAVKLAGAQRARVWRLYMAASANGFDEGHLAVHQVLGVVTTRTGESRMPRTRAEWAPSSLPSASDLSLA